MPQNMIILYFRLPYFHFSNIALFFHIVLHSSHLHRRSLDTFYYGYFRTALTIEIPGTKYRESFTFVIFPKIITIDSPYLSVRHLWRFEDWLVKDSIIAYINVSYHLAIIWINAGILLIGPLGRKFRDILFKIPTFSFQKIHLKLSSGTWLPFFLGLNVSTIFQTIFSNAFSRTKMFEFRLEVHWSLFLWFQLTINQQWFR